MIEIILVICLFVFITGACIGSFLNVIALRALSKESIILPPSKCPKCKEHIKWYDNIPIISYFLIFKGKCRSCGCKVSIQYPIVEFLTAVIFLLVYCFYGFSIKSLLLLILLCTSIVIIITDIKENAVFDRHSWILIITALIYSVYIKGIENYSFAVIGLITGVLAMEIIARLSYYLVKKKTVEDKPQIEENTEKASDSDNQEQNQQAECKSDNEQIVEQNIEQNVEQKEEQTPEQNDEQNNDIDLNINEYVEKNKRAFGEGDTYIVAASGAILGWKYLLLTLFCSIVLQALCILPQFIMNLYRSKQYRLLISLLGFFVFAVIYFTISNIITMNVYMAVGIIVFLVFFAIDSIVNLKKMTNQEGFIAIPFGPALLLTTYIVLFFGKYIAEFLNKHVFMMIV